MIFRLQMQVPGVLESANWAINQAVRCRTDYRWASKAGIGAAESRAVHVGNSQGGMWGVYEHRHRNGPAALAPCTKQLGMNQNESTFASQAVF